MISIFRAHIGTGKVFKSTTASFLKAGQRFPNMIRKTYSLILAATPSKDYSAGWLAGSVPAHLIACEQNGKVFWFCPVQFVRGVRERDQEAFGEAVEGILRGSAKIGKLRKGLGVSEYGYFYDADSAEIAWRFRLEKIFPGGYFKKNPEEEANYRRYFAFREIYLTYTEAKSKNCCWFLISDIRKITKPIKKVRAGSDTYKLPGFTYGDKPLLTHHMLYGGAVFTRSVPRRCDDTFSVKAEDETDSYLKQFFLTRLPDRNLQEKAIQQAFAVHLMKDFRNWSLVMEEKLQTGRPDVIFRDKRSGALVVVEIKRSDNDDPVNQLKCYVEELRARHKHTEVQGIVICGKKTHELEKKASDQGFKVWEYSISINFARE